MIKSYISFLFLNWKVLSSKIFSVFLQCQQLSAEDLEHFHMCDYGEIWGGGGKQLSHSKPESGASVFKLQKNWIIFWMWIPIQWGIQVGAQQAYMYAPPPNKVDRLCSLYPVLYQNATK